MYTDQLLSFIIDTNMYYVPSSLNFISPVFCLGFIEIIFGSKTLNLNLATVCYANLHEDCKFAWSEINLQ